MAIIECKECNGKVSDQAAACPHCGAPVAGSAVGQKPVEISKKRGWWKLVLGVPLAIFAVFIGIGLMGGWDPDFKGPVREFLRDDSARFSGATLYTNGSMCGTVEAKIIPERSDSPRLNRRFIVGPSGKAIVDDGSKIGTQLFNQMDAKYCLGTIKRRLN